MDPAANAESLGARVIRVRAIAEFREAIGARRAATPTTAIPVETDPSAPVPSPPSRRHVPVAETSALASTQGAHQDYQVATAAQRAYPRGGQ